MTSETKPPLDWDGRPVPDNEPDDKEIMVWEIEPAHTSEYDGVLIRDYRKAMQYARERLESIMDGAGYEEEDLKEGVSVTVKLVTTTVREYNNVDDD